MRALVCPRYGSEDVLEVADLPALSCRPDQVRIRVSAASVNFPDCLAIRGEYQVRTAPPFVPGHECAGEVVEVGTDAGSAAGVAAGVAAGDRVLTLLGSGAFATEAVATLPSQQLHRIPAGMSFDDAAAFTLTYGTAIHAFRQRARLEPGETVLVLGAAGGCGTAAVQVAKAMGATVIAVAGGPAKCEVASAAGADATIDHQAEDIQARVGELTGGRRADVLFDPVGGTDVRTYLRCLAWNGRYLVVGFAAGEIPTLRLNQTILKSLSVVGVAYGASAIVDPATNADNMRVLFDWYEKGLVRPSIGHRFPLERGADALRTLHDRQALGKVVITMS